MNTKKIDTLIEQNIIDSAQKEVRESKEFTFKMDEFDPDNKIPYEAIDYIIKWSIEYCIGNLYDKDRV